MSVRVCLHIYVCVWQEATRAVVAEWGFMMKFSGNLKSPIIEPESGKKDGKGERRELKRGKKRWKRDRRKKSKRM